LSTISSTEITRLVIALVPSNRERIVEFAAAQHLPAMYEFGVFVHDGGLMSYGPTLDEMYRRAATYVDQILKGAKPGGLPLEQPTGYFLLLSPRNCQSTRFDDSAATVAARG
jgi:putative ABC transport system substrate-binding protein